MAFAQKFEKERAAPVEKRRFLEPGLAVEARRDLVSGRGHVASDPRVTRFIGAEETDEVEVAEVAEIKGKGDEDSSGEARGWRGSISWRW